MKYILTTALAVIFLTTPAFAHHPLNGMPMETFFHGILSGVGHPVLGFDHLFFVIAMGVAAVYTARRYMAPLTYIAVMLAGCLMMAGGIVLPLKELIIAASLLVVGGIILSGKSLALMPALILFGAFGLFHGSAFGDSIAGQEGGVSTAVLIGYLIGLGVIQYSIAIAAGYVVERFFSGANAQAINARLAGALVAGMGLFLVLETVEGFILG